MIRSSFFILFILFTLNTYAQQTDTVLAGIFFKKGMQFEDSVKYDSAIIFYRKAKSIYENLAEKERLVIATSNIGECYFYLSNYTEAMFFFQEALSLGIKHLDSNHHEVALSYVNVGSCYAKKGKFDLALEYMYKALAAWLNLYDEEHAEVGRTYNNIGYIYGKKGDIDRQLAYYQKALSIWLKVYKGKHSDIADSYNNIGHCYGKKGNFDKQLIYHEKSLTMRLKVFKEVHPKVAESYSNIGKCYGNKGDYDRQLDYCEKALAIRHKIFKDEHKSVAVSYNNIGAYYGGMGDYDKQLEYLQKALAIRIKVFSEDHPNVAISYHNLGTCYGNKGDRINELKYLKKALDILLKSLKDNHPAVATTYNNIGLCYGYMSDHNQSLHYLKKALKSRLKLFQTKHPKVGISYNNIGEAYAKMDNWPTALLYLQKAATAFVNGFEDTAVYVNPLLLDINSKGNLIKTLRLKGEALQYIYWNEGRNLEDLIFSLKTYRLAIDLVDSLRFEILSEKTKQDLSKRAIVLYEKAFVASYQLYELTKETSYLHEAFNIAEKSKAISILLALQDSKAKKFVGIPDSLLAKERDLKLELAYYEKKLIEAKSKIDTHQMELFNQYLFKFKNSYYKLVTDLEKKYPKYYKLKYERSTITIHDIKDYLSGAENYRFSEFSKGKASKSSYSNRKALLEYFVTTNKLFVFVITSEDFDVFTIPIDSHLVNTITNFRNQISNYNYFLENKEDAIGLYTENASLIYECLFTQKLRAALAPIDQLIIVPDGIIHYLPFEALLTEKADDLNDNYKGLSYLLKQFEISYAYSASHLILNENHQSPYQAHYLGFAPSYEKTLLVMSKTDINLPKFRDVITPLEGNTEEIKTIGQMFDGAIYLNEAASENQFKKNAKNYGILHLAMHALIDNEHPMYSKLVFSREGDSIDDNYLNTYELYNMELQADLAVLSACNTGYGKLNRGEGLMSLSRAFSYAGCKSTVMSLWRAHDQITVGLMLDFFLNLKQGQTKGSALRDAKLKYLREADRMTANPYFWANFILVGDGHPLTQTQNSLALWQLVFISLGILLLLYLVWLYRSLLKRMWH